MKTMLLAWLSSAMRVAVVSALVFLLTVNFVGQGFRVDGRCMEPNLRHGERVLSEKVSYRWRQPRRGDVVVFRVPDGTNDLMVKRVIALPGERISIRNGQVFINGRPLPEPYRRYEMHYFMHEKTVPEGMLFVMGDNRDVSNDSRDWGFLPMNRIIARVWCRYQLPFRFELVR
jgi:signal peptidase I